LIAGRTAATGAWNTISAVTAIVASMMAPTMPIAKRRRRRAFASVT
jgi:hypothetical protein